MNINLNKIGQFFTKNNLWKKLFKDFNRLEIDQLCVAVFEALESTPPIEGWSPPYINTQDELVVPFNAPLKYRWWQGGQGCVNTLKELGASQEIIDKYKKIQRINK